MPRASNRSTKAKIQHSVSCFHASPYALSYILLIKVTATKKFTPGLRVMNLLSHYNHNNHTDFAFKIKPDIFIYTSDTTKFDPNLKMDSALIEIFIEVK